MKHTSFARLFVFSVVCLALFFFSSPVAAQDEPRGEEKETPGEASPPATSDEEEKAAVQPSEEDPANGPGWGILLGRMGVGAGSSRMVIAFDDPPRGYDDTIEMEGLGTGLSSIGVEGLFFPASGRRFMLTGALLLHSGITVLNLEEGEPGSPVLNERAVAFRSFVILGGVGYRFVFGRRENLAATIHFKLGPAGGALEIDGIDTYGVGGGVADLGGGFHYRFENRVVLGGQLDLRMWSLGAEKVEMLDAKDVDLSISGSGLLLNIHLGYEYP